MRFFLVILIILISIYFLLADSPPLTIAEVNTQYTNVFDWIGDKTLVPLEFNTKNKKSDIQSKPTYFYNESRDIYGKMTFNTQKTAITWFDLNGSEIGTFTENWQYDIPLPRYYIAQDAKYIICVDISSRIRLIDKNGNIEREFRLFSNSEYNSENALFSCYIEQNNELLLGFRQVHPIDETHQGYVSYLTLTDLDGRELFKLQFDDWQINGAQTASDGKHIIIPLFRYNSEVDSFAFRTVVINNDGKIIADFPLQHNSAIFNLAGNRVLFYKNEQAWIYDIGENILNNEIERINSNNIIVTGCFIDDKNMFILQEGEVYKNASEWAFRNIYLQVCDHTGNSLQQQELKKISIYQPMLRYNRDTEHVFLGHSQGWIRFSINN